MHAAFRSACHARPANHHACPIVHAPQIDWDEMDALEDLDAELAVPPPQQRRGGWLCLCL